MRKFLFFYLLFFSLNLNAESSSGTDTEAGFNPDARRDADFCCDRAYKAESAHDLSAQESKKVVDKILYSQSSRPATSLPPSPSSGQR